MRFISRRIPKSLLILEILVPIVIGFLIYLLFRPTTLLVFGWMSSVGLDNFILRFRSLVTYQPSAFIIYVFPDCLYLYSLLSFVFLFYGIEIKINLKLTAVAVIIVFGMEFIQLFYPTLGTFDFADIICMFITLITHYTIHFKAIPNET